MHFRFDLAGLWVCPFAARRNDDGSRAKQGFKRLPRLKWALVALHAKANTFVDVVGLCVLGVTKCRDRRAEDGRHVPFSRLSRAFGRDFQKVAIADPNWFDKDRVILLRFTIGERTQRNNPILRACLNMTAANWPSISRSGSRSLITHPSMK